MSVPAPAVIDLAAVSDARKKFLLALEGELLDYKHNVPQVGIPSIQMCFFIRHMHVWW